MVLCESDTLVYTVGQFAHIITQLSFQNLNQPTSTVLRTAVEVHHAANATVRIFCESVPKSRDLAVASYMTDLHTFTCIFSSEKGVSVGSGLYLLT